LTNNKLTLNMTDERKTGHNSGLAKVVIHYSANSLVVNQTLALRMNSNSYRNGENRQLLVLAKR